MYEKISASDFDDATFIRKKPLSLVMIPFFLPNTITETLANGLSFSSVTCPLMKAIFFWADAVKKNKDNTSTVNTLIA